MNHFEFFGLPVSFLLDESELRKRFLLNSKKYHPDFFTLENQEKQLDALERSTQNNRAFEVLSDFDKRMAYILSEKGLLGEEGTNSIPQDFLVQVMEIQESIMELEMDFDQRAFDYALQHANELEQDLLAQINPILQTYRSDTTSIEDLKKVKDFYLKKKYLWRIKENLNRFAPALKEA